MAKCSFLIPTGYTMETWENGGCLVRQAWGRSARTVFLLVIIHGLYMQDDNVKARRDFWDKSLYLLWGRAWGEHFFISDGERYIVRLICISLMANTVELIFMCLFFICTLSSVRHLSCFTYILFYFLMLRKAGKVKGHSNSF